MYTWTKEDKKALDQLMSSDDTSSTVDAHIHYLARRHGEYIAYREGLRVGALTVGVISFFVLTLAILLS